jgi:putative DNA primase/helicase
MSASLPLLQKTQPVAIQLERKPPRVDEFIKFLQLLKKSAPPDYSPYLLRLQKSSKNPVKGYSWKKPAHPFTATKAINWMKHGGNVGIAGTTEDPLVNMDCDGDTIKVSDCKPSLSVRTRSRQGRHLFYWDMNKPKIPNIATENCGEIRSNWEYVVAAGSYVAGDYSHLPEEEQADAGYYTVENEISPVTITFEELPIQFKDQFHKAREFKAKRDQLTKEHSVAFVPKKSSGQKQSAVYDVTVQDILLKSGAYTDFRRQASIFHDSDTQANMSLNAANTSLIHCWRHMHSLNALQSLAVLSGYVDCSCKDSVRGDDGALFHAWRYAKMHGYISIDDRIPVRAMNYIAKKHCNFKPADGELLPRDIYNKVLKIVEEEY